jgi:hypothetical protein
MVITRRSAPLLAVLVLAACATVRARDARERELEEQLAAWHGSEPLDRGWDEARRLLAERGYPLADKDADAVGQRRMSALERLGSPARATAERGPLERSLDTGWSGARDRCSVRSLPAADGWRIVFWRLEDGTDGRPIEPRRDRALELALVRRIDPAAAARIDAALAAAAAR